jgi:type IV secretory pathway VirD2 relaxase
MLSLVIGKLGAEEAPAVARFFVGHQNSMYVNAMHPVTLLLRDAEKLRTEWATKRTVTRTQAAQADKTQTNLNAFAPLLAEARAKEIDDQRSAA